ncbi:MAG TPA: AI-2E family transporter [Candidatus Kapabacteria bacterium]|nr:AI-2E family transporter [Candidatus Kapabacteria bacterium]
MTLGANGDPVSLEAVAERHHEKRRFDAIAIALGGVALVALAWTVRLIINPFIAAFLLYIMLARFRQYRSARSLMTTGFILFGLWLLLELAGILVPFILGAILAYLFNPLVFQLHNKRRINRTWSSLTIVILFTGALVAIGWILIPSLGQQTKAFIGQLTIFIRENANTLDERHLRRMLLDTGLPAGLVDNIILTQAAPELRKIVAVVPTIVMKIISGLPRILERTLNLIIVPIAMFYFLKDWPKLMPIINELFPPKNQARRMEILADVDHVLYGYVRGQATVALLIGILGAIAYSILGIPYAGLLGVILAVSDLVPIVGMIFSAFIVELVIFLTMQLNFAVIASGILVIAGLHLLEVYIVGPRIIGQGIGVPPLLMILALLVFGFFFGFVGLLIAVPTTGVILLFLNEYRKSNATLSQ